MCSASWTGVSGKGCPSGTGEATEPRRRDGRRRRRGVEVGGELRDGPVLEEERGGQGPAQLPFELPDEIDGGERVQPEGEERLVVGDRGVGQPQRPGQQPRSRTVVGVPGREPSPAASLGAGVPETAGAPGGRVAVPSARVVGDVTTAVRGDGDRSASSS